MAAVKLIDGSLMEGGGQILRMTIGFSALLGKPVEIFNIRGKRSKPGLKAQHLTGIQLVSRLSDGQLTGDSLHSMKIKFVPGSRPEGGGTFTADTGNAGAVTLLAQVSLPCLLLGTHPSRLDLRGGTNAAMAPIAEYYQQVFKPTLARFGAEIEVELDRKGYFPRGGGRLLISVPRPVKVFQPITLLDRGEVTEVTIEASVAGTLPVRLAQEMAEGARMTLLQGGLKDIPIRVGPARKETSATGNGSSVFLRAITSTGCIFGDSGVGSPKEKPFVTGEKAAKGLLQSLVEEGGCVDRWMQDQVVIYMALAGGKSRVRTGPLSLHTTTAIDICHQLTDAKFSVAEGEGNSFVVECQGMTTQLQSANRV